MSLSPIYAKRLTHIEARLDALLTLMDDISKAKSLNVGDPVAVERYKDQHEQIKSQADDLEKDYLETEERLKNLKQSEVDDAANNQLQVINQKLDDLKQQLANSTTTITAQVQTSEANLDRKLSQVQETLLSSYDASQQEILKTVIARIDQSDAETLQAINAKLDASDYDKREVNNDLTEVLNLLNELKEAQTTPPAIKDTISKVQDAVADEDSTKAKLKLALPLIPGILNLKADSLDPSKATFNLSLGILEYNAQVGDILGQLKSVWQRVRKHTKTDSEEK